MALTRTSILLLSTAICLFASTSKYGRAYDGHRLGAAKVIADDFVPEAGAEGGDDFVPEAGGDGGDDFVPEAGGDGGDRGDREDKGDREDQGNHDQNFIRALECFDDRKIYSRCDEEYRLSESGELKVSRDYTDQYCHGPCLEETNLVLECIEEILEHFRFYNKATVKDVRETIKAGCSYGPKRGDFDVAEHVRVDEDISSKLMSSSVVVYAAVLMTMGWHVLF